MLNQEFTGSSQVEYTRICCLENFKCSTSAQNRTRSMLTLDQDKIAWEAHLVEEHLSNRSLANLWNIFGTFNRYSRFCANSFIRFKVSYSCHSPAIHCAASCQRAGIIYFVYFSFLNLSCA